MAKNRNNRQRKGNNGNGNNSRKPPPSSASGPASKALNPRVTDLKSMFELSPQDSGPQKNIVPKKLNFQKLSPGPEKKQNPKPRAEAAAAPASPASSDASGLLISDQELLASPSKNADGALSADDEAESQARRIHSALNDPVPDTLETGHDDSAEREKSETDQVVTISVDDVDRAPMSQGGSQSEHSSTNYRDDYISDSAGEEDFVFEDSKSTQRSQLIINLPQQVKSEESVNVGQDHVFELGDETLEHKVDLKIGDEETREQLSEQNQDQPDELNQSNEQIESQLDENEHDGQHASSAEGDLTSADINQSQEEERIDYNSTSNTLKINNGISEDQQITEVKHSQGKADHENIIYQPELPESYEESDDDDDFVFEPARPSKSNFQRSFSGSHSHVSAEDSALHAANHESLNSHKPQASTEQGLVEREEIEKGPVDQDSIAKEPSFSQDVAEPDAAEPEKKELNIQAKANDDENTLPESGASDLNRSDTDLKTNPFVDHSDLADPAAGTKIETTISDIATEENPWSTGVPAEKRVESTALEKVPTASSLKSVHSSSVNNLVSKFSQRTDSSNEIKAKPFGKPFSEKSSDGSKTKSPLFGHSPLFGKSPTFSIVSSPMLEQERLYNGLGNVSQREDSSFKPTGSTTSTLADPATTYSPSLSSTGAPMSPTTRERATEEIKKIYSARGTKSVILNDLPLPFNPINRKKFPNSPKFDPTKSIVFAVCLCDFNHVRGPEIEHWIDSNGAVDINDSPELLTEMGKKWPTLPFQALPDGSHEFEETFSYFTVLYNENDGSALNSICDVGKYSKLEGFGTSKDVNSIELDKRIKENDLEDPMETDLIAFNENATTLWGISCVRQIATDELIEKSANVTRTSVQKSIVILCRQPIFGQLKEKLSIITKSLFLQKDFSDKSILQMLYDNLVNLYSPELDSIVKQKEENEKAPVKTPNNDNAGVSSILRENDFYVGLSLKEFIHSFKRNALVIFKAMLLERKILFFSKNIEKLCIFQLSLISLIPNLITNLNDCGSPYLNFNEFNLTKSLNLKTSNRYSLLTFLGLPLQLFGFYGLFNPYTPLQQLDDISRQDKIRHYIIGTSNDLLLGQKEKYCDLLINLDTNSLEFIEKELSGALTLTSHDKKFIDLIIKNVDHFYFYSDKNSDVADEEETSFHGSEDFIRLYFEDYLVGLLSSIKYDKFLNKLGYKITFEDQNTSPQRNPAVNRSMLVPNVDMDNINNFNLKFIERWVSTANYKTFDRLTDNEIFYIFEPLHVAMTENFIKQQEEFDKTFGRNNIIEGLNYFRTNVQNRLQNNPLINRTSNSHQNNASASTYGNSENSVSSTSLTTPKQNSDSQSTHSVTSASRNGFAKELKYSTLESGSFSLDDLTILNSINDEIEMNNPIKRAGGSKTNAQSKESSPKGSWMSSWSSWVKR